MADMEEAPFGFMFDLDGVISRNRDDIEFTKPAFKFLSNPDGTLKYPIVFVTNGCDTQAKKAEFISEKTGCKIHPDQIVLAQTPLKKLNEFHNKRVLISGQGKVDDLCEELGFKNYMKYEELPPVFPELDIVDHRNRDTLKERMKQNVEKRKDFKPIEALVMFGEPKQWDSSLQLMVDLLATGGQPDNPVNVAPEKHIPVIACNHDVVFKAEARNPRFGHGAYLACFEKLYEAVWHTDLVYTWKVGKPYEITFQYAEYVVQQEARRLGYKQPVKRLYFIGDNPEVDTIGANIYDMYIQRRLHADKGTKVTGVTKGDNNLATLDAELSAESCRSILVCTGVYRPENYKPDECFEKEANGHHAENGFADFTSQFDVKDPNVRKPLKKADRVLQHVGEAIDYILRQEGQQ